MMKKLQNIAAIFAAGALLLGAASCSHDGGASLATLGAKTGDKDKDTGGPTSATVKYLQLDSGGSSNVTPDFSATVSETSLVTATDLVWKLATGLTAKQFDTKINNNNVDVAHLEQQWTGSYVAASNSNALASVSFTITAVKTLKLKTISAITESGKTPTGITCWIDGEAVAKGEQYSASAPKAFKLSNVSLDDYEVAAGDTVTIKITCDKNLDTSGTDSSTGKVGFGQISLAVEAAGATGSGDGNTGSGGDGNTGSGGDGNTGSGGEEEPAEEPVPFTGSFVGLNGASFGLDPLAKGDNDIKGTISLSSSDGSVSAGLVSPNNGALKIVGDDDGKATGIKYNGTSLADNKDILQSSVTVSELSRYISVPVKNGKTITVSYTANTSGNGNANAKVVLADKADGSILQTETVDTTTATGNKNEKTISTTVSDDIDVLILFSRENSTGGGIIVTGFKIQ